MRDEERLREEAQARAAQEEKLSFEANLPGPFRSNSPYHNTLQGTPIHGLIASATGEKAFQMNAITHTGTANIFLHAPRLSR